MMLNKHIKAWATNYMQNRKPDVIIGAADDPYLLRWWIIPRNKFFNLYLHRVLRSDDDRALHDHPWINLSYIVEGQYNEHTIQAGGIHHRTLRKEGSFKFRLPRMAHRLELLEEVEEVYAGHGNVLEIVHRMPCTTLFFTGPNVRIWGFHCMQGWIEWTDFTRKTEAGTDVTKGCGEVDPSLFHRWPTPSRWWPKSLCRRH
jgi:hypothetical protein